RPSGNLTGIGFFTTELAAKRLELVRELLPTVMRVAVLVNPANAATTEATLREVEPAARTMGLQIQVFNANTSREIDAAFESMGRERPDALFVATTPFLNARVVQLAQLATFHRLPAIYGLREYTEAGGLISYGANIGDAFRQAGVYTGRILKGAKPDDLPVVHASKFELVINAPTARIVGLGVPDRLVAAAGEVIEGGAASSPPCAVAQRFSPARCRSRHRIIPRIRSRWWCRFPPAAATMLWRASLPRRCPARSASRSWWRTAAALAAPSRRERSPRARPMATPSCSPIPARSVSIRRSIPMPVTIRARTSPRSG